MNSEIEYENFIKNIDLVIYDKIDIDNWNISIDLIFEVVEFLQKSLEELRTIIIEHPFESKEEEIYFFKYIKPEVLGRLLYFTADGRWILAKYFEHGGWQHNDIALVKADGSGEIHNLTSSCVVCKLYPSALR